MLKGRIFDTLKVSNYKIYTLTYNVFKIMDIHGFYQRQEKSLMGSFYKEVNNNKKKKTREGLLK